MALSGPIPKRLLPAYRPWGPVVIAFVLTLALLVAAAISGYGNAHRMAENQLLVVRTHEVIESLAGVLSTLKDAETGQRGFLLVEEEPYLEPYAEALERLELQFAHLDELTAGDAGQAARLGILRDRVSTLLANMERTLTLIRAGDRVGAIDIVRTDSGRKLMDEVRRQTDVMLSSERAMLEQRADEFATSYVRTIVTLMLFVGTGLVFVSVAFFLGRRRALERERHAAAVAAQREHLRLTLASIGDGVITTDTRGCVVTMNPVASALTGWTGEQAAGVPLEQVFRIVNEETREPVENPMVRALRDGVVVGLASHALLIAKDGTEHSVDDSASPIRDAAGTVTGCVLIFRDITERGRAEQALRHSEERFRTFSVAASQILWTCDATGMVANESPSWTTFTGKPIDAWNNLGWLDLLHPDDREPARAWWQTCMKGSGICQAEYRLRHATGDYRWHAVRVVPVLGPDGNVREWIGTNTDVSERKQAELQLRESELRFRTFADQISQCAWTADSKGNLDWYNRRWFEYTGTTLETMKGWGWKAVHHPDHVDRVVARVQRSWDTGEPWEDTFPLRGKDGQYRWFLSRAVPIRDDEGNVRCWFGTNTDIDDLRRVEGDRARLASLAENSTDFIGVCDEAFRPDFVNRAGMQMVGLDDLEHARRIHVRDFFFSEDQARIVDKFLPGVMERGSDETEVRFRHFKTGEALWMLYRVFLLKDAEGRFAGLATVSRDITERKLLEERLRRLAADLSEGNRRKDEFLATLAHELRNPLAPIRNGLHIMRLAGHDADSSLQARTMIERQVQLMIRLVDDLLDVSRITRGVLELRLEQVTLEQVVGSAIETCRPIIDASGNELVVNLLSEPVFLTADATRLGQVFANLLNNAAKYSAHGGRITLSAELRGNEVAVSVHDTGVGIPTELLPRVFDMFMQVDRSLERSHSGLGIGLTLVKRLVELHGGRIEARSDGPGTGSTFVVHLPWVAARESGHAAEHSAESAPTRRASDAAAGLASGSGSGSGGAQTAAPRRRILIADDNEDSAQSLAMMLAYQGNEVRTAHDGVDALAVAAQFRPVVVLLDIGMPRLNGYETCRRMRQEPWARHAIIIALTGWGHDDYRSRSVDAGFDHHFVKPMDLDRLQQLFASLPAQAPDGT